MKRLEGFHHITAITGEAQVCVDFYAGVLGLRLVKRSVNYDAPNFYHLYFGAEDGAPGSLLTFFEYPGAARGRAGEGMFHRIEWRVADAAALSFWEQRLDAAGTATTGGDGVLSFADPEGLAHELCVAEVADGPLLAETPGIPAEHAIRGLHGVRAFAANAAASSELLRALEFESLGDDRWEARGEMRGAGLAYDPPPDDRSLDGAGTIHHVAWSVVDNEEQQRMRVAAIDAGARATPSIDRQYFRSVYFRDPNGILFELATLGPGFAVDEAQEVLGSALMLPPQHEHLRERLEQELVPLINPRDR